MKESICILRGPFAPAEPRVAAEQGSSGKVCSNFAVGALVSKIGPESHRMRDNEGGKGVVWAGWGLEREWGCGGGSGEAVGVPKHMAAMLSLVWVYFQHPLMRRCFSPRLGFGTCLRKSRKQLWAFFKARRAQRPPRVGSALPGASPDVRCDISVSLTRDRRDRCGCNVSSVPLSVSAASLPGASRSSEGHHQPQHRLGRC